MSESLPPNRSVPGQMGLDLSAERPTSSESVWPLYDGLSRLQETHFSGMKIDTVVSVRPLRNAAYQSLVDEYQKQYDSHQHLPIGPALLYRLAVLNLLANRPQLSSELLETAIDRAANANDKSRLLAELARVEMERLNHAGALAVYQRLAEHEPDAFPFPLEHYQLESVLGAGGCSTVFLCRETSSGRQVVVKALDVPEYSNAPIDPLHEASLLEQLQHSGVVKLLAKGFVDSAVRERPYLVLEYLPGMTLHDYVTRCGPLSWQNWLPIARQVLATLQAVHAQRIVHRDLKPGNLLLQFDSHGWLVKLIDFGIAIRQQFAAGTQGFAPPEQFDREVEMGPALDVYAFGRTSCFALTGQPEIEADSFDFLPHDVVTLIRECQAKSARSRPGVAALIASIDSILAKGWSQKKESSTRELITPVPGPATPKYATDIIPAEKTWIPEERDEAMNPIPKHPGLKALVVESSPQDRDVLSDLLAELGFEVGTARGWPTAIRAIREAAETEQPFLVLFVSADLHHNSTRDLVEVVSLEHRRMQVIVTFDSNVMEQRATSIELKDRYYGIRTLAKPYNLSSIQEALRPEDTSTLACMAPPTCDDEPEPPRRAPLTTLGGPADPPPAPPTPLPDVYIPASGELAMWRRESEMELPKTTPPWALPSDPFAPRPEAPAPPSPAQSSPAPPRYKRSGDLAMRGGPEDDDISKTLPPWPQFPFPYIPAQSTPAPPPAPPMPAPPRTEAPGAGSAHADLPGKMQSVWERLQDTVGGWFKSKPRTNEQFHNQRDESMQQRANRDSPVEDSATTAPQRDEVDCTVYAPPQIDAGETILIQAMLHLPEEAAAALALAQQYDDTAAARGARTLDTSIERGARLAFQLTLPGLEIDDATPPPIVWRGRTEGVQFGVTAPADSPARNVIGTVLVTLESVPIGQIKFKLAIVAKSAATIQSLMSPIPPLPSLPAQPHKMSRYQMVFISYASPDRDEVLKRVQMLKRFNVNFFQDVLSLEPGERWEQALYRHIDQSDLFLLFWSTAAKNSKWVQEEVKYALELHARSAGEQPEIVPIVLEGPPVPTPLPELAHLHFNDQILHFVADRYSPATP